MKSIVWIKPGEIELQERVAPNPPKDWAKIKTIIGGICGSDITIKDGKHPRAKPPLILGHELVGIVEELNGSGLYRGTNTEIKIGDRVSVEPLLACGHCRQCTRGYQHVCENLKLLGVETDGGFAEYFIAPINRLYAIPKHVPNEHAALLEPLSVATHAVNIGMPEHDKSAVILGAGPIGLLIALVLKAKNIRDVWISEINDHRLSLAKSLGLRTIDSKICDPVERVLEETNGKGADITFDAAGVPQVGPQLIPMTAIKGKIIMVALHKKPCEVFFRQLSYSEQSIHGVRIYAEGDFAESIKLLASGAVDVKNLISHIFTVDDYQKAFDTAANSSISCKVLISF